MCHLDVNLMIKNYSLVGSTTDFQFLFYVQVETPSGINVLEQTNLFAYIII